MTGACVPATVAQLDIARSGELQAAPGAARRQAAAALARELIGQRDFLAAGVTQDDRAERADVAVVQADDLLALPDGLGEQLIGFARHCAVSERDGLRRSDGCAAAPWPARGRRCRPLFQAARRASWLAP